MILNLNKQNAYVLTCIVKAFIVFFASSSTQVLAQDTISLSDVEVSAQKIEVSSIGKKTEEIDSLVKKQFKYASIAELLSYNSTIHIKNYGPGAIASSSFRGANASQTAVLWNGFNLQNAMLGQSDLALMPSVLFEKVNMEYGGSSSTWGGGAIGGSIHLMNKTPFGQGVVSNVNIAGASFGTFNGSASVSLSKQKFISTTKLYLLNSKNDFKYKDTLDKLYPLKTQKDSEYNFKGVMQELKCILNSKQILSVNAWLNSNQRHLPNYNSLIESKIFQKDEAARFTANWTYLSKQYNSIVKAGYFKDAIDYTDSTAQIFSKSKVGTLMIENENYFNLHRKYELNLAVNVLSSQANTDNYNSIKSLSRASLLLGNKFTFLKQRLISYISLRAEYFSVGTLPVTGNVSVDYKLSKHISAKINGARVYRQPSLNELYWKPGGNINLKPEEGFTYEGEINYSKRINHFYFFISGAAYSRKINNWILWLPGSGGNPSPVNIQQVWSRGTETSWKINYSKKKWFFLLGIQSAYVLSTVESNTLENDNTINKQLIYTPRYTGNAHFSIGYVNSSLNFYHQYTGYRFTTSDNLAWLNPYQVSSLRITHKLIFKQVNCDLFAACNNLANVNYTIMAGRPMPLRNYEFGISINTKTNK